MPLIETEIRQEQRLNLKSHSSQRVWMAALVMGLPMLWNLIMTLNTTFNFDPEAAKHVAHSGYYLTFGENIFWYLMINIGTLIFPFLLSFDRKVTFYKDWKAVFLSIFLVGTFFLIWDIYFTKIGVWGFNPDYYYTTFLGLPIGEWSFFLTVPYACIFIHACLKAYFPNTDILKSTDNYITPILIVFCTVVGLLGAFKAYTNWTFLLCGGFLFWHYRYVPNTYRTRFYLAYLISLIPFTLVNGILTGGFNEGPVVLYNNAHNLTSTLGGRMVSIPFDDFSYCFLLLMVNVAFYEYFLDKRKQLSKPEETA
ncbi:MAG: lycopene cyclase domain-containing protein [Saprospiraceae bacterium]|nr:lycopene cyclase domain-containing protein [Saprospiraceae bacterium]